MLAFGSGECQVMKGGVIVYWFDVLGVFVF
jgi:hypothetical protein